MKIRATGVPPGEQKLTRGKYIRYSGEEAVRELKKLDYDIEGEDLLSIINMFVALAKEIDRISKNCEKEKN